MIEEFEEEFKRFTGVKHAIACCNGTAALHTALIALGIKRNDVVITTPFSFISSSNCILYCGATPVFADINPKTYCIASDEVKKQLERHYKAVKAVICVHLFGNVCEMDSLMYLCGKHNVALVEDCAQALGARYKGRHVGNFGQFGTFSFYVSKNLWTFEGGMLITNDDGLAKKARMIINHGRSSKHVFEILGYNYRITPMSALLGLTALKRHKKAILTELGSYGIKQGYYPYVIYDQPLYKKLGIGGNCPNAKKIAEKVRRWEE